MLSIARALAQPLCLRGGARVAAGGFPEAYVLGVIVSYSPSHIADAASVAYLVVPPLLAVALLHGRRPTVMCFGFDRHTRRLRGALKWGCPRTIQSWTHAPDPRSAGSSSALAVPGRP